MLLLLWRNRDHWRHSNAVLLEDLPVETRWPENAADDLLVEIESVGNDQWKFCEIHPVGDVAHEGQSVPVASSSDDRRWPEPRRNFDRREDTAST